ncbi:MAG: MFS transporter [Acidobacteria bacterium]|nr:MFS transporter [Acidobacteriota bacterium]
MTEPTGVPANPRTESPETLFNRGFVLVCLLTFLTFFAAFQLFPTVPIRLRELGVSLAGSGRFLSIFTFGSALGALATGPLGDRVGHRRIVVGSAFAFALFLLAYALIRRPWLFFLLAFPHGVVWSGLLTSTMATLSSVLPQSRRVDGLSLYGLASPGGVVFGPALALWLQHRWGFPLVALLLAVIFTGLAFYARILPSVRPSGERRSPVQLPEGKVLAPCLILFTSALGYGALTSYTAQEALALGTAFPSAFLTAMAVGMVAMRLAMIRVGFGERPIRLLPGMLGGATAGMLVLTLVPGGLLRHALAGALYGGGYSMMHTLLNAYVLDHVDPGRRGAAFGALLFSFDSGIGLGAWLLGGLIGAAVAGGPLAGVAGYRVGWAAGTLLLALAWWLARRLAIRSGQVFLPGDPPRVGQ